MWKHDWLYHGYLHMRAKSSWWYCPIWMQCVPVNANAKWFKVQVVQSASKKEAHLLLPFEEWWVQIKVSQCSVVNKSRAGTGKSEFRSPFSHESHEMTLAVQFSKPNLTHRGILCFYVRVCARTCVCTPRHHSNFW